MKTSATRVLLLALAAVVLGGAEPPSARPTITPYFEADQIATTGFRDDSDVLTYTQLIAGVDASAQSRRVSVQIAYEYERTIPESRGIGHSDSHQGLAEGQVKLTPALSLEGGAVATRVRGDIRGRPVGLDDLAGRQNTSQAYAAFAGPTLAAHVGDLQVNAAYRLAYVRIDDGDEVTFPGANRPLDRYATSWNHVAAASVGMRPGAATPFGWTVSGAWSQEHVRNLHGRSTDRYARVDVVQPISPTLAVTGGVGYQDTRASTDTPLITAGGLPVIDDHGRYQSDRTKPRLVAYDVSGLIYDAGVTWKPSHKTSVEVHVGRQYDDTFVAGSATWQARRDIGLQVVVFDGVTSFGRELTQDLATLPGSFQVPRTGLSNSFGGCVFGTTAGTGGCLNDALQSVSTTNFHQRGGYAIVSGGRGPWTYGVSGSYVRRDYLGADGDLDVLTLNRITDQSIDAQGYLRRDLGPRASLEADVFGGWYKTQLLNAPTVKTVGADGSLFYTFSNHMVGTVAAGVSWTDGGDFTGGSTDASLLLGLRYQF